MKKLNVVLLAVILVAAFAVPVMAADTQAGSVIGNEVAKTTANAKQGWWRCGKPTLFWHAYNSNKSCAFVPQMKKWLCSTDDIRENQFQGAVDSYNWICIYWVNSSTWSGMKSYYY